MLNHAARDSEIPGESANRRVGMTQLSPAHREIIDLAYYHGKSIEDVAKIVGIAVNTVKTRMFYARKHLAELLCRQGITTAMA
jgi:RNA polymerase sigma-70 factor (ECF subfamily)